MNSHLSYTELLDIVRDFDVVSYAKTRNHLSGTVSKLSPHITRGVIDLPTIRDLVLKKYSYDQAEKFIQELSWREYFQKVWWAKGDAIFSDLRFPRTDWVTRELPSSIVSGQTGIEAIDAQLQELFETGYMHNHARMWTAMLACNIGKAHWNTMSRWMYYHLFDGDLASNTLSWQWVAGTSVSKRYTANQSLINACSGSTQQSTYIDMPAEQIGTGDIPSNLISHQSFTYTTPYPTSDTIEDLIGKTVFLYHPWSLDPLWRNTDEGVRILVLEPRLFDRFPIGARVMDFILSVAKTHIPQIHIYVGNIETIPGIKDVTHCFSKQHGTTRHWPGTIDSAAELFPTVTGYFPSFFSFWQECKKTISLTN